MRGQALLVANKSDLAPGAGGSGGGSGGSGGSSGGGQQLLLPMVARDAFRRVVRTSALTRQGLEELEGAILELAGAPELASGAPAAAARGLLRRREGRAAGRSRSRRPRPRPRASPPAPCPLPSQAACPGRSTRGRRRR